MLVGCVQGASAGIGELAGTQPMEPHGAPQGPHGAAYVSPSFGINMIMPSCHMGPHGPPWIPMGHHGLPPALLGQTSGPLGSETGSWAKDLQDLKPGPRPVNFALAERIHLQSKGPWALP